MLDVLGRPLEIGHVVAIAKRVGNSACLITGRITDLDQAKGNIKILKDENNKESYWMNGGGRYPGPRVVILGD